MALAKDFFDARGFHWRDNPPRPKDLTETEAQSELELEVYSPDGNLTGQQALVASGETIEQMGGYVAVEMTQQGAMIIIAPGVGKALIAAAKRGWRLVVKGGKAFLQKGGNILGITGRRGIDAIVRDTDVFLRWLKHKHPISQPLSPADARKVWDKLLQLGKNPRLDPPHPGTKWNCPHINVDGNHIPVDPGFKP
jgi:hypothetical protein